MDAMLREVFFFFIVVLLEIEKPVVGALVSHIKLFLFRPKRNVLLLNDKSTLSSHSTLDIQIQSCNSKTKEYLIPFPFFPCDHPASSAPSLPSVHVSLSLSLALSRSRSLSLARSLSLRLTLGLIVCGLLNAGDARFSDNHIMEAGAVCFLLGEAGPSKDIATASGNTGPLCSPLRRRLVHIKEGIKLC